MKKIYLMLLGAVIGFSAHALELKFWMGNQEIVPGSTVEFTDIVVDTYDTYKEVTMKPELYVSSNIYTSTLSVKATCTSGQSIQMCAGGLCKGGESVTKENVTIRSGVKLDLGFDYISEFDLDEEIPVVTTLLEAEDPTEAGSKVEFVLVMSEEGASLERIEASQEVKSVAGGLWYDIEGRGSLEVYGADGVCRFSGEISGTGLVGLPSGLYVYTLSGKSGKIYVK